MAIVLSGSVSAFAADQADAPAAPDAATGIVFEPITISSSKGESVIGSASTVSVISRSTLDKFGFRTIADAVDARAGVSVQRTYFKQSMITGRGILEDLYANKNLVLIDGIPLWHAISGEPNIDRVGLTDTRRIEVLRGPASVIYGSQAYTSAVNIVLKRPISGERSGEVYSGIGTDGAYEGGANLRVGASNGLGLVVAANGSRGQRTSVTFTDEANVTRTIDDYANVSNLTVRGSYKQHTLIVNRYDNRETTFGPSATFASGAGGRHDVEGFALGYKGVQPINHAWSLEGMAFYDWSERDYPRTVATNERSRITGNRRGAMLKNLITVSEFEFELGVDHESRLGEQFSTYSPTTYSNSIQDREVTEESVFGQAEWHHQKWRVVVGSRYSDNSTSGSHLTSRATGVYELGENQSIKLIAGQSYRSPSLLEMFSLTASVRGNPNLEPETAESMELSYQVKRGAFYIQALGYYAKYEKKIFRVPDPTNPARNTYINGEAFDATGVEIELSYTFPRWGDVFLNVDAVNGSEGDAVPDSTNAGKTISNFKFVPTYNVAAGWAKSWGAWSASLVARHTPETDGPKRKVDGFTLVDASVGFEHGIGSRMRVSHRIYADNIFDEREVYPEFSRRRLNEVQAGSAFGLAYRVSASF